MKVVINKCWGDFGLSQEAYKKLNEYGIPIVDYPSTNAGERVIYRGGELAGSTTELWNMWLDDDRTNPLLVKVVEELGDAANNEPYSKLKVVEIPDDVDYYIDENDGMESIHEEHRIWS